jgi:cyanophycin synthetase
VDEVVQSPEQGQLSKAPSARLCILREQVYRGPNVWSRRPAINLTLDLAWAHEPKPHPFVLPEELLQIVPSLRNSESSSLPQLILDVALGLQSHATGHEHQGTVRLTGATDPVRLIFGYSDERVALRCGRLAVRIGQHLIDDAPSFDELRSAVDEIVHLANLSAMGGSTRALVDEGSARGIPHSRLDGRSLVQFGQGVYQRRISGSLTSSTSALGVLTAGDKQLTAQLLRSVGLPVPDRAEIHTADEAADAALRLGFPVVLKRTDGNGSVSLGVRSDDAVRAAFDRACRSPGRGAVLVEKQVEGRSYRLLVVGGRVVAIAERVAASVVGDGASTVRQLVDTVNDPRRGTGEERELTRITLDDDTTKMLETQGLTLGAVPSRRPRCGVDVHGTHVDRSDVDRQDTRGAP